jgi:hypothetical protein
VGSRRSLPPRRSKLITSSKSLPLKQVEISVTSPDGAQQIPSDVYSFKGTDDEASPLPVLSLLKTKRSLMLASSAKQMFCLREDDAKETKESNALSAIPKSSPSGKLLTLPSRSFHHYASILASKKSLKDTDIKKSLRSVRKLIIFICYE